jgi:hypothetical protein
MAYNDRVTSEDEGERLDRELIELFNGLRVVIPGVQVLAAFLLTVPFTQRFDNLTENQRIVYFAAFICATLASLFLIAPSTYHRLRWRQHDKERLLRTANVFAIVGTVFLGLAVMATVFVVTDLLFGLLATSVVTAVIAGILVWCWFGLPLWRRLTDERAEAARKLVVATDAVADVGRASDEREGALRVGDGSQQEGHD